MIPPRLGGQQRVLRVTGLEAVEIVRERALQQVAGARPFDLDLPHVRDVEDAGAGAHGPVLGDHALVLDGHLPAGERHHARAQRHMAFEERRAPQRLHRRDASPSTS